jgi:DNA-binding GntR family transcriptional regulator
MAQKSALAALAALAEVSSRAVAAAARAAAVYERLRADMAHGLLEPGSKLRVDAVCQRDEVGAKKSTA